MSLTDGKRKNKRNAKHPLNWGERVRLVKRFLTDSQSRRKRNPENSYTYQPSDAIKIGGAIRSFSVEDKKAIEVDVCSGLDAAISACETLLANIETYHAAYGLEHFDDAETPEGKTQMPWPNASDLTMP